MADKELVYVLKRGGAICGTFSNPPADPDEAAAAEVMEIDHPDVVAFRNRPLIPPGAKTLIERVAAIETDVTDLKRGRP